MRVDWQSSTFMKVLFECDIQQSRCPTASLKTLSCLDDLERHTFCSTSLPLSRVLDGFDQHY